MKNYISIIIPCYNVEKYIGICIDSILNETFKNYEIILVDDRSTDNTFKVLKEYEKKYKFIKVLQNKTNSGAGYSRNRGLEAAKYDLISFIDSDDYVEKNFHEELLKTMIKEKSDLVVCDIFMKYEKDFEEPDFRNVCCAGKVSKFNILNTGLAASPCNKIFKKDLFNKNEFPEGIMNEDVPAILSSIIKSKKISYTEKTYYNYIQRKTSVQNEEFSFKRFNIFKAVEILDERIKNTKDYDKNFKAIVYNQIIVFLIYVIPKEKSFSKRYKILKEFNKLSKKYNIRQNNYYWDFLDSQPKKSNLFYRLLFKFTDTGHYLLADILIQILNIYKSKIDRNVIKENIALDDLISAAKKQSKLHSNLKLSVVVPNYNYAKFLYERLYSILYQTEKIDELIILDDCSKDNSRELIDKIYDELKDYINIKKIYNETNSGTAFKQWKKGFEEAKNEYVWIAEADDYCNENFLKNILKPIKKDNEVVISYSDTAFMNVKGDVFLKSIKPEIDIMKTGHWDTNFINKGSDEIKDYAYLNCTIANVSSVVFKKKDYSDYFKLSGEYKQAGDWLFYANVMNEGKIAYTDKVLNYYRVHGNNVTTVTKKQAHFDEIKRIHDFFRKTYGLNKEQEKEIDERYKFLKRIWKLDE